MKKQRKSVFLIVILLVLLTLKYHAMPVVVNPSMVIVVGVEELSLNLSRAKNTSL